MYDEIVLKSRMDLGALKEMCQIAYAPLWLSKIRSLGLWARTLFCLVLGVGTGFLYVIVMELLKVPSDLASGLLYGFGIFLILSCLSKSLQLKKLQKDMLYARGIEIRLSPESVRASGNLWSSQYLWQSIYNVSEGSKGLWLWLSPIEAIPVFDKDLPEGLTRDEVKARIEAWRGRV